MDKLKDVITEYGRWSQLSIYIDRVEAHIDVDFGLAIENSKSILESVSKEICEEKAIELTNNISINALLKKACIAIGYEGENLVTQLSTSIANIGHQMGNLRNEIGSTSHGRTMQQLESRNQGIDQLTKEFLIDTTELVACFLIRNFENENSRDGATHEYISYQENEDFNDSWDDSFGEFAMGDYSYPASELLFNVDKQAYVNELKEFIESDEE